MHRATLPRDAKCRPSLGAAAWPLFLLTLSAASVGAQSPAAVPDSSRRPAYSDGLDSVIARALATSAGLRAESARARAARSRIAPAGARPDPMLMAGVRNVPLSSPSLSRDEMTMSMAGVSQTIPYRGKRPLRTRVARAEADAA